MGGSRAGSAAPPDRDRGAGGAKEEPRAKQRRTLSAPAAGHRRSDTAARKAAAKKGRGSNNSGGVSGSSVAASSSAASQPAAVGTRAALQELLIDGGRRTLPNLDPSRPPVAYRASTQAAAGQGNARKLADVDPHANVLTLPWGGLSSQPLRAPQRDGSSVTGSSSSDFEPLSNSSWGCCGSRAGSPRGSSRLSPRPGCVSPRPGEKRASPRDSEMRHSRGASPKPRAAPLPPGPAAQPPLSAKLPTAAAAHPPSASRNDSSGGGGWWNGTVSKSTLPAGPPPTAISPRAGASSVAAGGSGSSRGGYLSSDSCSSSSSDEDAAAATAKAMEALAAAAGGAKASKIPAHMSSSIPGKPGPGLSRGKSMPALGLARAGLTGGGCGLVYRRDGIGGVSSSKSSGGGGGSGLDLKLDLAKLEKKEVLGDRPDEEGRQPPTPTALIVERLKAAAAAAAAGEGDAGNGASAPAAAAPLVPVLKESSSLPDVRLGRADLSISKALQELSIQELSVALSHHSSNRSLLSTASWAVDASEIKFGRRLGAGAYGEVYEADWRRSRVAVKRLFSTGDVREKAVREFFAEMEVPSHSILCSPLCHCLAACPCLSVC